MRAYQLPNMKWHWGKVLKASQNEDRAFWSETQSFGAWKPETTPDSIWQIYVDVKNKSIYVSYWYDIKDWKKIA